VLNRPTVLVDGECSEVVDNTYWPILIATWFGRPSEALVEKYFGEHDRHVQRARNANEKIIVITDTFATERPNPVARKRIVELTEAQGDAARAVTLRSYIVIENPVIRGVVTALGWVYPKFADSENVGSLAQALELGVEALRSLGIPAPVGLVPARHTRPARPTAA
jgi:hypothetical protein